VSVTAIDNGLAFIYKYSYNCPFCAASGVILTKVPETVNIIVHPRCGCEIKISKDLMVWS
jgi:transcription elongation factor Elf1